MLEPVHIMIRKETSMKKARLTCAILLSAAVAISLMMSCRPKPNNGPGPAWESHFGFMPTAFDFQTARKLGARWDRPFFQVFDWDVIEPQPGQFNWTKTEHYIP